MYDFEEMFRERSVRVLLKDGSSFVGQYHMILKEWAAPTPTMWFTSWSNEHMVALNRIAEVRAA